MIVELAAPATSAAADDDDEGSTPAALSAARRMEEVSSGDRDSPIDDWSSDSGSGDCGVCRSGMINCVGHVDLAAGTVSHGSRSDGSWNRVLRHDCNRSRGMCRACRPSRLCKRGAAAGVAGAVVLSMGAMVLD